MSPPNDEKGNTQKRLPWPQLMLPESSKYPSSVDAHERHLGARVLSSSILTVSTSAFSLSLEKTSRTVWKTVLQSLDCCMSQSHILDWNSFTPRRNTFTASDVILLLAVIEGVQTPVWQLVSFQQALSWKLGGRPSFKSSHQEGIASSQAIIALHPDRSYDLHSFPFLFCF